MWIARVDILSQVISRKGAEHHGQGEFTCQLASVIPEI
jgi:hypothetical protein